MFELYMGMPAIPDCNHCGNNDRIILSVRIDEKEEKMAMYCGGCFADSSPETKFHDNFKDLLSEWNDINVTAKIKRKGYAE